MAQRSSIKIAALLFALASSNVHTEDKSSSEQPTPFAIERFYKEVRQLARRHYPDATSHLLKNKIHFEHHTRLFIVHEALKTGKWQDPWAVRGPKQNGIHCDIEFRKGPYQGAAEVPQSFDKRYFIDLLLAPYSEKLDAHLYVHLKYPTRGRLPEGFLKQFTDLINGFERFIERPPR